MDGRFHTLVVHYESDMHEFEVDEDRSNYSLLVKAIFQALLGDDYGDRTVSFSMAGLVRGYSSAFPIDSDTSFYNLLLRNRNEEDHIQLVVSVEEVITHNTSPPVARRNRVGARIIEELPEANDLAIVPWMGVADKGNPTEGNAKEVVENHEERLGRNGNEVAKNQEEGCGGNVNQADHNPLKDVGSLDNHEEVYGGNGNQANHNPLEDIARLDNQEEGYGALHDQVMDWGIDQLEFEEAAATHRQEHERELRIEKDGEVFDNYVDVSDDDLDDPSYDKAPYKDSDDETERFGSFVASSNEEEDVMTTTVEVDEQIGEALRVHSSFESDAPQPSKRRCK